MKRSEMIKIMLDSYVKEVPMMDDGGVQLMIKLDRLLTDMESAGMLPPVKGNYDLSHVCIWESEDV